MSINLNNINIEDFKVDITVLLAKQKIIIAIITSIIILFIVSNVYKAQRVKIRLLTREIKEEEEVNRIIKTIQLQEKAFSEHFNLFIEKEATLLMQEISEIAATSNIRISSLKSLAKVKANMIKKTPFRLQIIGNYHDIGKFISRIESSDNVFKIDRCYLFSPSALKIPDVNEKEALAGTVVISAVSIEGT